MEWSDGTLKKCHNNNMFPLLPSHNNIFWYLYESSYTQLQNKKNLK